MTVEKNRKDMVFDTAVAIMKADFAKKLLSLRGNENLETEVEKYFIGYNDLKNRVAKMLKPSKDKNGDLIQNNRYFNINDAFFRNTIESDITFFNSRKIILKKGEVITIIYPLFLLDLVAELNRGSGVFDFPSGKKRIVPQKKEKKMVAQ